MKRHSGYRYTITVTVVALVMLAVPGTARGEAAAEAVTVADPQIPLDELDLLLTPLTKAELAVEADAWLSFVKAQVKHISGVEIAVKRKNAEIENLAATPEAADARTEAKREILADVNKLRDERTALIDRANVVLDALDAKGGESEEFRKYLAAVSGIRVDVSDTTAAWTTVAGWASSEEGGLRWARNLGKFTAIVIGFWLLSGILGRGLDKALSASRNLSALMREFVSKFARRIILAVGVIVALSALEVNIGPLLAVIGAAGFVVAFALQDTLGNFASGIMILVYRPFDVGDLVEVGGVTGKVASLNLVSVTINTLDNKVVLIPNNSVWGGVITNATGSTERRVDMVFGISYDDDIRKAQAIMEQIVADHALVLGDPEPVVRLHELADSSVNFVCRPWVKTDDYWTVYWDVTQAVKEEFDQQGVSIPYPQRDVHVHPADAAGGTTAI